MTFALREILHVPDPQTSCNQLKPTAFALHLQFTQSVRLFLFYQDSGEQSGSSGGMSLFPV